MTKKLYTKSKALGLDYLKDRNVLEFDDIYIDLNVEFENHFFIDTILEDYDNLKYKKFNYKNYLDICKNAYKEIESYIKKYLDDTKYIISFYGPNIIIYKYESEDEFIKRKVKQLKTTKKSKLTKPSKIISELQKEIQELEKLKIQTERKLELKRSKLKGI